MRLVTGVTVMPTSVSALFDRSCGKPLLNSSSTSTSRPAMLRRKTALCVQNSTPVQLRAAHPFFRPMAISVVYHILLKLNQLFDGIDQPLAVTLNLCRFGLFLLAGGLQDNGTAIHEWPAAHAGLPYLMAAVRNICGRRTGRSDENTGRTMTLEYFRLGIEAVVRERLVEGDAMNVLEIAKKLKAMKTFGDFLGAASKKQSLSYGNFFLLLSHCKDRTQRIIRPPIAVIRPRGHSLPTIRPQHASSDGASGGASDAENTAGKIRPEKKEENGSFEKDSLTARLLLSFSE